MAALITLALVMIIFGACVGVFLKLSFAIRREDRARSVRFAAPNATSQIARDMVGISGSRWK
jgi:hypothetical protein